MLLARFQALRQPRETKSVLRLLQGRFLVDLKEITVLEKEREYVTVTPKIQFIYVGPLWIFMVLLPYKIVFIRRAQLCSAPSGCFCLLQRHGSFEVSQNGTMCFRLIAAMGLVSASGLRGEPPLGCPKIIPSKDQQGMLLEHLVGPFAYGICCFARKLQHNHYTIGTIPSIKIHSDERQTYIVHCCQEKNIRPASTYHTSAQNYNNEKHQIL